MEILDKKERGGCLYEKLAVRLLGLLVTHVRYSMWRSNSLYSAVINRRKKATNLRNRILDNP